MSLEDSEKIAERFVEVAFRSNDRKKLLITDLDNTLWSGVIGEDGAENIQYGSDGSGFSFNIYQRFLLKLKSEGVLLAFCSKNNVDDVLPEFDALDMPLHLDDFVSYRCNWRTKSQNIREMVRELNVGLDSAVHVDDCPVELSEIETNAPEVTCIRTPESGDNWQNLFCELQTLFASWKISAEDKGKTDFFKQRVNREDVTESGSNHVVGLSLAHVKGLDLKLGVYLNAFVLDRSLELINKTNQFNLHGERISTVEWLELSKAPGSFCMAASLEDRYGSFGVVVVIVGQVFAGETADIRQMVVSCRAFGRGVEYVALYCLVRCLGLNRVVGRFVDTGRNNPALEFLQSIGCEWDTGGKWSISRERIDAHGGQKLDETGLEYLIETAQVRQP